MLRFDRTFRCPECSGDLQPLSVCRECKSTTVADLLNQAGPEITCAMCGSTNATRFVCTAMPRPGSTFGDAPTAACSRWYTYDQVTRSGTPLEGPQGPPSLSGVGHPSAQLPPTARGMRPERAASPRRGLLSESPTWSRPRMPARRPTPSKRNGGGRENATGRVNGLVNGHGPAKGDGRVNGLVNGHGPAKGMGRVNGLVNGRGVANETGRTNGLVNGNGPNGGSRSLNGLVNGIGIPMGAPPRGIRPVPGRFDPRYLMIAAALLMAAAIVFQLVSPPARAPEMTIDGSFSDWTSVPAYAEGTFTTSPNVRIRSASLKLVESSLFFRVEVAGSAFADPADYDSIYAFLDVDGNLTSGYDLGELGADYLARASGSAGAVEHAVLLRFEGDDPTDWNAWRTVVDLKAAATGRELEVEVPTRLLTDFERTSLRTRFASEDNGGETSHTVVPIGLALGALRVTQQVLATTLHGGPQPFLSLRFDAIGTGARVFVERVELRASAGSAFASIPEGFEVAEGTPVTRVVTADPLGLPAGSSVSAGVAFVAADRPYAILGTEARAYVGQPPPEDAKRIDGLFADWPNPTADPAEFPRVKRSSMDIVSWDASAADDEVFLYARFLGPALEGSPVPDRVVRHRQEEEGVSGSAASPRPPPPRVGRDYVRFYLGTDEPNGGVTMGGRSFDRLIDVQGRWGRVDNASAYRWSGAQWRWEATVSTGLGAEEIEAGAFIPDPELNATWSILVTADWSGIADSTEPEDREGTRGSPGLIPLHGTNALTALANALTNLPTVDGNCGTSSNEYQGADERSNANLKFFVGRRSATSRVYLCLEVTADTTDDGTFDSGRLMFDRNHDGGSLPQSDDRRFRVTSGGSLTSEKGNGAAWVSCGGSCYSPSATGAFNNSRQVYEFSISFWDVWATNSTTAGQVAGFAVLAFDDTTFTTYTWGSDNVNQNNPGTWGHLQIAEFPAFALPVALAVAAVLACKRPLDRRTGKVARARESDRARESTPWPGGEAATGGR